MPNDHKMSTPEKPITLGKACYEAWMAQWLKLRPEALQSCNSHWTSLTWESQVAWVAAAKGAIEEWKRGKE